MNENKTVSSRESTTAGDESKGLGVEAPSGVSRAAQSDRASLHVVQVKICGLTEVDEAVACAELGANAIGCVFYPRSPRYLSEERARDICRSLPSGVCGVGVFVNEGYESIMNKVERCGLKAVQLHGREPADLVDRIVRQGVLVIKAVFLNGSPSIGDAQAYEPSAYLVECAGGPLPGGNAMQWDWAAARGLAERGPFVLAGGLHAENASAAIQAAWPDGLDVSSGVELKPGRKDLNKVKLFIDAVLHTESPRRLQRVFQ
jgi:phosphoribosylanthranilate isomerase